MADSLRVMIVDHEAESRDAGQHHIMSMGHRAVCFLSVAACVPHLSRSPVDAILLELHLPQLGGLALLRTLRKRSLPIPVVVTGVHATPDEQREIHRLGGVFLPKPYTLARLRDALADVLPASARRCVLADPEAPAPTLTQRLEGRGLAPVLEQARLPVLDPRVSEVQRFLTDPSPPSSDVIAGLVEGDPRLSAALVQRANSVSFRGSVDVVALPVAITRLGIREVLRVVLEVMLQDGFEVRAPMLRRMLSDLWSEGVAAARDARELAQAQPHLGLDPDEVFMAALMHDLGRPYLVCAMDRLDEPLDGDEVREAIEAHHARAGARLLIEWGMPPALIGMARTHDGPPERLSELAALVRLSSLRVQSRDDDDETRRALERRLLIAQAGAA